MSLFDPEVTYEDANLPDHAGETYHGHEGVLRAAERWIEPFEWLVIELEQIIEAGDRLVSTHRWRAKARHTGIEFDTPLAYVWTFRDGRVVHFRSFLDPEQAIETVSLRGVAVSQQNVDIAKRAIDAFNRRDVDLLADLTTPDFEWFPALPGTVEGGGYRGREGIETYISEIGDTWEELRIFGAEFRDLGDRVLVLGRAEGRGRGSGVPVDTSHGFVVELRGDKMSRVRTYLDHGEALRAAGLVG
jgi:ketosteroid isomerase-like protein